MPGLMYVAPTTFTGPDAAQLPVLIPDLPANDPVRRFTAASVAVDIGEPVVQWRDSAGSSSVLVPAAPAATAPTLADVDGVRSVLFNGTSDGLRQSADIQQPTTIVLAARILSTNTARTNVIVGERTGSQSLPEGDNGNRLELAAANMYMNAGATANVGTFDFEWHIYFMHYNGPSSSFARDGNAPQVVSAGSWPIKTFTLGYNRASEWSNIAVAEALIYDRALTSQERLQTVAALRAAHGIA